MNFLTESLDFPQNEQRRCLSCDIEVMDRGGTSRDGGVRASESGDASVSTLDARMCNSTPRAWQGSQSGGACERLHMHYFVAASAPFGS